MTVRSDLNLRPGRKRRLSTRVAGLLLAITLGFPSSQAASLQPERLDRAIEAAQQQLIGAQLESGFFDYDFDFLRGKPTGKSNIVRQAGTAYALGEAYAHQRTAELREPLRKAVAALAGKSIPVDRGELISFNGKRSGIKGGATALALLAELYYYRNSGDGRFAQQREAWLQGLLGLRRPGAGFLRAPDSTEESHYYNGEVWLALAFYIATFESARLERQLRDIDRAMMAAYGKEPHIGFFHWGAMAAERRFRDTGREELKRFAQSQAENYLTSLRPKRSLNANTCYSLEGMIPALSLTGPEDALYQPLESRIEWEMRKIMTFQIQPGQTQLDLGDGILLTSPDLAAFGGAFIANRKTPLTRIDYTQHCLSAIIKYKEWREAGS
ncbi:hypothetical protein [Denitrobaculum tricleocarpae]|uniref:Alginate lyase domain-containing protein n=1 Tax=Denitrobaculum tricleocarpae TaxID=2591009 RepID=A0A545U139_9PROT|nr:hypothetical protein [Denitrobaculum tricleocarpae]TQV83123.1 hypothetical protein FKG95_00530 [Denitrobaculum tricleocarpae]